jgi:heme-degrading monooxygenase HmoA
MLIVTVHHHCREGMLEQAERRIDANGTLMKAVNGFLFRYRMIAEKDPLLILTVTGWANASSYDEWLRAKPTAKESADVLFCRTENNRYHVKDIS